MNNTIETATPSPANPILRFLCWVFLKVQGWTLIGKAPTVPKYIGLAAPHTSNWDFLYMMTGMVAMGISLSWFAKNSLFKPPLGWIMKPLGGIPVDRTKSNNLVDQMVEHFENNDKLAIAILPEGTRSFVPYWKSGFYHIALRANVPLQLGYADYKEKVFCVGPLIYLTGDVKADMDTIREFFEGRSGRFPANQGPIRLRMEEEDE